MSTSLTLESLFGDLNLDLGQEPEPTRGPVTRRRAVEALPSFFAADAEATLELVGFTSASALLSDADLAVRPTQPYDIPADELAQNLALWGDDERFSALSTAPVFLDELPEEAWPTQFTPLELE
ncbi:MAG: hypothetical protein JNJ54_30580 [Myxococcaceae bacterium]|nr:hypothetical protein [Myxococcaceae bacterium]